MRMRGLWVSSSRRTAGGSSYGARREVVLCAGVVNSPQLLMLSGVGHREHLRRVEIKTIHHSPEVGENLQDHLVAALGVRRRRR